MLIITRKFEFDAGHRVLRHESKCRHLHGHRYVAEITITAPELDDLGRIIDFSVVKGVVGSWIDENWDHNLILHPEDPLLSLLASDRDDADEAYDSIFGGKEPFVLDSNPTAENISRVLFKTASDLLSFFDIKVTRVKLYETPNCWAEFSDG